MRTLLFLLCLLPSMLSAQGERFDDFRANISIDAAGNATVQENIAVTANAEQVKRGITRPLRRRPVGEDVAKSTMDYRVVSVARDGAAEDHHTKTKKGYRTVYFGNKDVLLAPGRYQYEWTYTSEDRVYFLEERQEIRWSVFSSDLRLPVSKAEVTLELPADAPITSTACFVGRGGSLDQSRCQMVQSGATVTFSVPGGLKAGEGMDIATAVPPGTFPESATARVAPPTPLQRKGTLYVCLVGILTTLMYGYTAWQRYGVDPPTPEVRAQYYPPNDISPASLAYLNNSWASQQQLTASLTALAIKGYLEISEEERSGFLTKRDVFIIRPLEKKITAELPPEQAVLYDRLYAAGDIELDGDFSEALQQATSYHNESLSRQHKAFLKEGSNLKKVVPWVTILVVTLIAAAFFLKHATGEGIALFVFASLLLGVGSFVFVWLIGKPSPEKVRLWAETKALKKYLKLKEADRKRQPNAPAMTKAYFQQVLPYAIALGIENDWAGDLSADIAGTINQGQRGGSTGRYMPPYMMTGFGNKMGSAYAAVATPPGSSSGGGIGGGGGVSSGGGGSGGW